VTILPHRTTKIAHTPLTKNPDTYPRPMVNLPSLWPMYLRDEGAAALACVTFLQARLN